jgi:hypothetical protein
MILRCIAFIVAALTLANCCVSGTTCAPVAGGPVAWDGLGTPPTEDVQPAEAPPRQHARAGREIIVGPLGAPASERNGKAQLKDAWEQEQAADQADDAKLKRKLMICRTCLAGESARDDAASSSR